VRVGDVHREAGRRDDARKAYLAAEQGSPFLPKQPRYIIEGAYAATVEELLKRGNGKQALDELDKWEWAYPTARLDGYNLVLRARANLILGNFPEARKQAETFLKYSEDPNYLPEALLVAAEACKSLGDTKTARKYLTRLVRQYPESPSVDKAKGLLRVLK
jgi:tetratricopeptide (TPR) repeat protein